MASGHSVRRGELDASEPRRAHLCDVNLYRVNLTGACLDGAQLVGAMFWECDLTDIDLGPGEATSLADRGAQTHADVTPPPEAGPPPLRRTNGGRWVPLVRTRDTNPYAKLEGYNPKKARRKWWRRTP